MILQILNIGGGTILAAEKIGEYVGKERMANFTASVAPYQAKLGVVLLVFGLIGLLERLSVFYLGLNLGSSFPQALPLIATGLLLGEPLLARFAFLKSVIDALKPFAPWLGLLAIACGLGSILFGCVRPICYPLYF